MHPFALAAALFGLVMAERLPALRHRRLPFLRPFFATDAVYLATAVTLLALAPPAFASWWQGASSPLSSAPFWLQLGAALLLYDLVSYATHVLLHRSAVLWEVHKVHHSSMRLDWLATYRAHILEHALRILTSAGSLLLLGFPPAVVAAAGSLYGLWAALGHANLGVRWRFLEPLLITPRLHRMHHVPATSERNLGTILSVWDRLCGTLDTTPTASLEPLGVPGEVETYPQAWPRQAVEPLRRCRARLQHRLASRPKRMPEPRRAVDVGRDPRVRVVPPPADDRRRRAPHSAPAEPALERLAQQLDDPSL
jgi:lathosterol oxidase